MIIPLLKAIVNIFYRKFLEIIINIKNNPINVTDAAKFSKVLKKLIQDAISSS